MDRWRLFAWLVQIPLCFSIWGCHIRARNSSQVNELSKRVRIVEDRLRILEERSSPIVLEEETMVDGRIEEVCSRMMEEILKDGLKGDIRIFGESVPVGNQDVRERIEKWLLLYLGDIGQVSLWVKRGFYIRYAERELDMAGLPRDIVFLMVAESSVLPTPYSSAGAAGMWQFMRWTGERMGLKCTMWYDERLDYEKSTASAIKLLSEHYRDLKNWTLSCASYNMGKWNLERHIETQLETDYWRLSLPRETMEYIPRIVAIKLILEKLKSEGIFTPEMDHYTPLEFEKVEVEIKKGELLDLRKFAILGGSDFRTIELLNPEFPHTHAGEGKYSIRVPAGKREGFERWREIIEKVEYDEKRGNVYFSTDSNIDTLYEVAEKFDLRLYDLKRLNSSLSNLSRLKEGTRVYLFRDYP